MKSSYLYFIAEFSIVFAIFLTKPMIARYLLLENTAATKQIRYICRWSNKRERYGEAETDGQIEGAGANPVQATIQQESIHLFGLLIRAT